MRLSLYYLLLLSAKPQPRHATRLLQPSSIPSQFKLPAVFATFSSSSTCAQKQPPLATCKMATPADADAAFQKMDASIPKATSVSSAAAPAQNQQPDLPPLSAQDFRIYNRMAEHMDLFHNNFRKTWDLLYRAGSTNKRPQGMSLRQFLGIADDFAHHLTVHHTIEEQHIFPVLARKMPAFKKELELLSQHKRIHEGLHGFEEYVASVKRGEVDMSMAELQNLMDKFGGVLWEHLDDEVKELRAENMRKYWTKEEMRGLPM